MTTVTTPPGTMPVTQAVVAVNADGTAVAVAPTTSPSAVQGNVASGVADSGNPVKVGGVYNTTKPTLTNGQRGDVQLDTRGSIFTVIRAEDGASSAVVSTFAADAQTNTTSLYARSYGAVFNGTNWDRVRGNITGQFVIPPAPWVYAAATGGIDNTNTAVTIKAAAAAGIKNYVTQIQIAHATLGAPTEFAIRDGAAGTVLWRTLLHTTAMATTTFEVHLSGTAATLLEIITLTAVTGDVMVNVQGYTAP